MKLNVNLKIEKREEHEGRRKSLHLASVSNTRLEVNRDLRDTCNTKKAKVQIEAQNIAGCIMKEVDQLVKMQNDRDVKWYNNDRNLKTAVEEVALMKEMAHSKLQWWEETAGIKVENIDQLSMLQVLKFKSSKNYHEYCELNERYSHKRFDLNKNEKVDRIEFGLKLGKIGRTVFGHEWSEDSINNVWKELKQNDGDEALSLKEMASLRRCVASRDGKLYVNVVPAVKIVVSLPLLTLGSKLKETGSFRAMAPEAFTDAEQTAFKESIKNVVANATDVMIDTFEIKNEDRIYVESTVFIKASLISRDCREAVAMAAKLMSAPHFEWLQAPSAFKQITLQHELEAAALKVIEAWVDRNNLNQQYGVDRDTALFTAAA